MAQVWVLFQRTESFLAGSVTEELFRRNVVTGMTLMFDHPLGICYCRFRAVGCMTDGLPS